MGSKVPCGYLCPEKEKQHIQDNFGNIDIYLFDQILKGTYDDCYMILDAGCGTGRNLLYLLKSGANVFGVDQNPEAIEQLRTLGRSFPQIDPEENFKVASVEQMRLKSLPQQYCCLKW